MHVISRGLSHTEQAIYRSGRDLSRVTLQVIPGAHFAKEDSVRKLSSLHFGFMSRATSSKKSEEALTARPVELLIPQDGLARSQVALEGRRASQPPPVLVGSWCAWKEELTSPRRPSAVPPASSCSPNMPQGCSRHEVGAIGFPRAPWLRKSLVSMCRHGTVLLVA